MQYQLIRSVSASDRNLAQRIYDEIKHLCKLATAGSKEARELERVKKAFEDAFREANNEKVSGKEAEKTKYSLENANKRKYNKRSRYSETETLFLSWENGPASVGEVKKFVRYGKIRYYQKTENGCVELSRSQYNERTYDYVEDFDRRAEREIGEAADYDESTQRGVVGYNDGNRDTYGTATIFGQTFREELSDDTAGSVSRGNGYDSGTDLNQSKYDEEASDNSDASSLITFSNDYAAIRNFMKEDSAGSPVEDSEHFSFPLQEDIAEMKNPAAEGGVKYALSDGTVKNASELSRSDLQYLLESAQNGELSDNSFIPLRRNTPEFFIGVVTEHSKGTVVVENYPMAVTVEHIRQNMDEEDGQSYGEARPHGFSVDDIVTISEKMGDPSYIVLQKNGRYAEVVSFYNNRNKQVVVAIDFANSNSTGPKNYKYSQYMNGYGDGYYNIIVTQYEPDSLAKYLNNNEVVYSKKEMNGRYQVGSGRIVTVTHDTPFIDDIISEPSTGVKEEIPPNSETRDVFGFTINKNANINEDLLEELSVHDPTAEVDADGNITVYHRTSAGDAENIQHTGIMKAQEDALFFSSKDSGYATDYGDTVVKLKIPSTVLQVNDIFDGEVHFDIPLKYKNGGFQLDVSQYLQNNIEPSVSYSISADEQAIAPESVNPDINLSMSNNGDDIAPIGNFDFYGKDFRKKTADGVGPVGVIEDETTAPDDGGRLTATAEEMATTKAVTKPLNSYSAEKQKTIRSYVQAVDEQIKSFVKRIKGGDLRFERRKVSDVSERAAADIKRLLGIDVSGYTHNINTSGVQHILVRHGANGKQDTTMSVDDDIARVGWVLDNYDSVELLTRDGKQVYSGEFKDKNNQPIPQIRFIKRIDGTYYVVEAACENEYRKLWVQSAYLQKNENEDVTQVSAEGPKANHKTYAQGELASPSSNNIIPELGPIVNEDIAPIGNFDFYGKDFRKKTADGVAPVAEAVTPVGKGTNIPITNPEDNASAEVIKRKEV